MTTANRPRRSRQVRSSRRRSVDRAIRRGRPRAEVLSEYHRAGGQLDKHERIIAGLERKAEPLATGLCKGEVHVYDEIGDPVFVSSVETREPVQGFVRQDADTEIPATAARFAFGDGDQP